MSAERASPPVVDGAPREPESARPASPEEPRYQRQAMAAAPGVTFWDLLGHSPEDRIGVLLIGAGAIAVVFAALSLLRFG